ncbi:hypothetical protein CRG98_050109 [Punica granatum]|uniref:CCHC-type domain-containing protein n=1 Tax=Punica granatum TaxID=22663 RepID=A0A2I0GT50_PUNGR|nr:hypothetical protein CRG98_050109 [Punica granatum]
MWQLTGIPCAHAIACMAYNNLEPEKYVHTWYSTERWRATYVPYIEPIVGESDWHRTEMPPIEPPAFKRPSGRPKQKRRQSQGEASNSVNSSNATRKYGETHCSRCGEAGHNIRRCTNEATNDALNRRGNRRTTRGPNASDSQVEAPLGPSGPIVGSQDSIILGPSIPVSLGSIRSASHSSAQVD